MERFVKVLRNLSELDELFLLFNFRRFSKMGWLWNSVIPKMEAKLSYVS